MIQITKSIIPKALLIIVSLLFSDMVFGKGFDYTPTIIQVNKHNQNDTVGFNLVESSYALFYEKIVSEKITLWDSPAKKVKISSGAFLKMEAQNGIRFVESEDLFIYEYWRLYKKKFESEIIGFSFFSRNQSNEKFNFGYIDALEVKTLLSSKIIPATINGSSNITFWQALNSKVYQFNIAKFGTLDLVKNPSKAFEIKEQIFNSPKIKTNQYIIQPAKDIEYFVYPSVDNTTGSYWLCQSIQTFYQNNRSVYAAESESEISQTDSSELIVTRVDVTETWLKDECGVITYVPNLIQVFINGKPLKRIPISYMEHKQILVQFKPLHEFIRDKNFKYTIKRINSEPIYAHEAEDIAIALPEKPWNKIKYKEPNLLKTIE